MKRLFRDWKGISFILLIVFILLIIVPIANILVFRNSPDDQSRLIFEYVKFIIIGLLGGLLIQEYNRRRDKDKALNEFRKNILNNLTRAYFKIKRARRILDGNITKNTKEISYLAYETQIKDIIDAQLEFEYLHGQLATYLFNWDELTDELTKEDNEEKLKEFLTENFNIDWVETAKIDKPDDKTIIVSNKNKSLWLKLDKENKVNLKIQDSFIRNQFFNFLRYTTKRNIVKKERGKIYKLIPHIFSDKNTDKLVNLTRKIEHNLKSVIDEYQRLSPSTDLIWYDNLQKLKCFITKETFRAHFSEPSHECVESDIQEVIGYSA